MADDQSLHEKMVFLVQKLRNGDLKTGDAIVSLLDKPLRVKLKNKIPPNQFDDAYQETWMRFFDQLLKGVNPDNYVAWFLGIARFVHYELIRQESKTTHLNEQAEHLMQSVPSTSERATYAEQVRKKLLKCLDHIPKRYSQFLIGHIHDRSRKSLCDQLNLKLENYAKFLHRSRKSLLACLGETLDNLKAM